LKDQIVSDNRSFGLDALIATRYFNGFDHHLCGASARIEKR